MQVYNYLFESNSSIVNQNIYPTMSLLHEIPEILYKIIKVQSLKNYDVYFFLWIFI